MDIYLDMLLMENIVMNYIILFMTARLSKVQVSNARLFIGALIGASYVVILVMFPGIKVYYSFLAKILLSSLIIAITFSPEKIKEFVKILGIFYISTFVFAGAAFAFLYFNQNGGFVRNGIVYVYWKSRIIPIILSSITVFIIGRVIWDILQYKFIKERLLLPIIITFESKNVRIAALVDTGNSLRDPLTNLPVIVVEFNSVKNILPEEIRKIFEQSKENDLNIVTNIVSDSSWFSRFRLVPFTSLGKENGMLIGFKPDYIEIEDKEEKKGVSNVIVAIYNMTLSRNDKYTALLSPELV